jgi:hypothetical protein
MNRRNFIKTTSITGVNLALLSAGNRIMANPESEKLTKRSPLAITMWDFSWLERRWPDAGYEDWDKILKELTDRGYNAVRIDAYPHLVSADEDKIWRLKPVWNQHDWGSPAVVDVQVQPNLNTFIATCKNHGVKVGLSSWYREDVDNTRMKIITPEIMAQQWVKTLESIKKDGLLDNIFYVDLCNEWPGDLWTPYFTNNPPDKTWGNWHSDVSMQWMQTSVNVFKEAFPDIPVGFSFDFHETEKLKEKDLSFVDYGEPHIWMCHYNGGEFYNKIGYVYDLFKPDSYNNLALNGKKVYEAKKEYWQAGLKSMINSAANMSELLQKPLITTECWGVVDYKDWPLLDWDWIKELCSLGVTEASKKGCWLAIATSNFCAPQFRGMWRDVEWHQKQTQVITSSEISNNFKNTKLCKRINE